MNDKLSFNITTALSFPDISFGKDMSGNQTV